MSDVTDLIPYADRDPFPVKLGDGVRMRKTDDGYVVERLKPDLSWESLGTIGEAQWGNITGTLTDQGNVDTDGTLAADSDAKLATQKAVKAYVDSQAGGGGSFPSANVARVDPSGSDEEGEIGELDKPFATPTAAITAFEVNPSNESAILLLSGDRETYASETITTRLSQLTFIGNIFAFNAGSAEATIPLSIQAFSTLTLTNQTVELTVVANCVALGEITADNGILSGLLVDCRANGIPKSNITNEGGNLMVFGPGAGSYQDSISGVTFESSGDVRVSGFLNPSDTISVVGVGQVYAENCLLDSIESDPETGTVHLIDARCFDPSNIEASDINYEDIRLNPAFMDFSTLPTTDPEIVGQAWVDGAADFVVKVSQGPPP